ncbi:DUF3311 domain-containing protein [Arthrobacter sp. StoSoilB5]|uniref:DUF3311 domain-containing protein n=1 Tax=Arthrobacter sp. StoSoilB5 TaxID=2830992 RepID=UPI001CC47781|nr:DUF3311 domain-containing protein [Arthrobacter sp. StoSoilB5]BCW44767.1 hypothetical protein StoSoilB5_19510 [Arthrobacter sp. StoSoilB5]
MTHSEEPRPQSIGQAEAIERPKPRRHWWLLLIPYLWCIAAIPAVNRVGYVFGNVPFLLVWMVAGVIVTSACITVVYFVDRRNGDLERI